MWEKERILQRRILTGQRRNEAWLPASFPVKDNLSRGHVAEIVRSDDCSEFSADRRNGDLDSEGGCMVWNLANSVAQGLHVRINLGEEIADSM